MADHQADDLNPYSDEEDNTQDNKKKGQTNNKTGGGYASLHATGFKDFLLKAELLRAIGEAGFEHPSEVQVNALPRAIDGKDLMCQAKAGMGKTAVFALSVLQSLDSKKPDPNSALILCHAKELAYQIHREFDRLGKYLPNIKSDVFFGGIPLDKDKEKLAKEPAIIVGTPGRILDLWRRKLLNFDKLRFFILDECDRLLEQHDMKKDITEIFTKTPVDKQVMMFSATLPSEVKTLAAKFMQHHEEVLIDDEHKLVLEGILQYYVNVQEKDKTKKLVDLLDNLQFNQVVIFVSKVERAIELNKILQEHKFPSMTIHSRLTPEERLKRYKDFKDGTGRILVSTDLFSRGVDIEKINIVINYDMPIPSADNKKNADKAETKADQTSTIEEHIDTYMHRVGRTARFGTKGLAISFIASPEDQETLKRIQARFLLKVTELPDSIDTDQYMNQS
jgi:ATP-dependent RNA helicase UAP56/SUB2